MNDPLKLKILSQSEFGFVSIREGYDLVHLSFKNILLNFTIAEFIRFRKITKKLLVDECLVTFPDGNDRVILKTPFQGINFCFDSDEIDLLLEVLDEAYYLQEIYFHLYEN